MRGKVVLDMIRKGLKEQNSLLDIIITLQKVLNNAGIPMSVDYLNMEQWMNKVNIAGVDKVILNIQTKTKYDKDKDISQETIDATQLYLDANQKLKTFYTKQQDDIAKYITNFQQYKTAGNEEGVTNLIVDVKNYFVEEGVKEQQLVEEVIKAGNLMLGIDVSVNNEYAFLLSYLSWIVGAACILCLCCICCIRRCRKSRSKSQWVNPKDAENYGDHYQRVVDT